MPADTPSATTGDVGGTTRFEVLGPVRVRRGERELDLGFPQQRALLALLLAHTGRPVTPGEILDALWGERPPVSAPNVVRRYVGSLRRLLEPGLAPRVAGRRLLRSTGGYLLQAHTDEVDLLRFRELTRRGKRAAATGRAEAATGHLVAALGEWRGPVAMGIPESVRAHVPFTAVRRELLDATRLAADAALLCGRADVVLPALRRAVAHDPLDEPLHARLVLALAARGLQAEALGAYDDVRRRLARDLDVAPGPELSAAHTRVLRQEVGRLRSGPVVSLGRPAHLVDLRRATDPRTGPTPDPTAPSTTPGPGPGPERAAAPGRADAHPDGASRADDTADGNGNGNGNGHRDGEGEGEGGGPGRATGPDDPTTVSGASDRGVGFLGGPGSPGRSAGHGTGLPDPGRAPARPAASGAAALRRVGPTRDFRPRNDGRGTSAPQEADPRGGPAPFTHPGLRRGELTPADLTPPDLT
ncbi:BTAD domain-containing putative transcriptional regulator, partial [Streptomyces hilarionis]|uniref:BTAD domain-containing putative transcriptional regulator n=1 Tax=Streptomyces hilarionis TaxID=2839954 RepID=UPI002119BC84